MLDSGKKSFRLSDYIQTPKCNYTLTNTSATISNLLKSEVSYWTLGMQLLIDLRDTSLLN